MQYKLTGCNLTRCLPSYPARYLSVIAVCLATILLATSCQSENQSAGRGNAASGADLASGNGGAATETKSATYQLRLVVDGEPLDSFSVKMQPDVTVLDVLRHLQESEGLQLEYTGSGESVLVTGIRGHRNDPSTNKFWIYFVNDQMAGRSCGVYRLADGDQIRWEYGSSPF